MYTVQLYMYCTHKQTLFPTLNKSSWTKFFYMYNAFLFINLKNAGSVNQYYSFMTETEPNKYNRQ